MSPGDPGTPDDGDPAPIVRPKGYVEDEPVVRQIGNRDLYLGNYLAARPDAHDHEFGHVLSASTDPQPSTTHHHPLADGPGNEWSRFAAAVDATRDLYRSDGALLVHCTAGISRSTALVATTLAAEEGHPLRDAIGIVQDARPPAVPHPALHELAVVYLAARSPRD